MASIIARRATQLVIVLFAVSTVLFFLLRLSGDPVIMLVGDSASPETITRVRHDMGFDAPLPIQYVRFVSGLATLHFGDSISARQDALQLVLQRLPYTVALTVASVLLAIAAGIPVGIFAGSRRGSVGDGLAQGLAVLGQAMPSFWLGILLILVFAVQLHWLPSFGSSGANHLVLPAVTLATGLLAKIVLLVRSGLAEVLDQDFVRTARAKGVSTSVLLRRHALPNVLFPVISVVGMDLGQLLGGAIITETIFACPGLGRQLIQAVANRDYPMVQASVFVTAVLVVLINMAADLVYRAIDPRVEVA